MNSAQVAAVLSRVYDPELCIDVVSLGLIYAIGSGPKENQIEIEMALTSGDCPLARTLIEGACRAVDDAFPGCEISVEVVDDPPWDVGMASPSALAILGIDRLR